MEYLCSHNNYVARASLRNRMPFEAFWGEMPYISMIWFKFLEPVYYQNWTDKAGKILMYPGRFVAFAWNISDPMTVKVLQCNEDMRKRNIVLHRCVVVPHSLTARG